MTAAEEQLASDRTQVEDWMQERVADVEQQQAHMALVIEQAQQQTAAAAAAHQQHQQRQQEDEQRFRQQLLELGRGEVNPGNLDVYGPVPGGNLPQPLSRLFAAGLPALVALKPAHAKLGSVFLKVDLNRKIVEWIIPETLEVTAPPENRVWSGMASHRPTAC